MTELSSNFDFKAVFLSGCLLLSCGQVIAADSEKGYYPGGEVQWEKPVDGNGLTREFYQNGKLKSELSFKNGKPSGKYKEYNKKGLLTLESEMQKDASFRTYKTFTYYDSGKLHKEVDIQRIPSDKANAQPEQTVVEKEYYPDGALKALRNRRGYFSVNGRIETYYPNSKPKTLAVYQKGKPISIQTFQKDGQPTIKNPNLIYGKILILPFGPKGLTEKAYESLLTGLSKLDGLVIISQKDLDETFLKELAFPDPKDEYATLNDYFDEKKGSFAF